MTSVQGMTDGPDDDENSESESLPHHGASLGNTREAKAAGPLSSDCKAEIVREMSCDKPESPGTCKRYKYKAWLYPDLQWGLAPNAVPRYGADFLKFWEFCTAVACLYVGIMVPLALGFQKLYMGRGEQCLFRSDSADTLPAFLNVTRFVDIIVDLIFWIDMFFNFVTARWLLDVNPVPHWKLVDDIQEISYMYITGLFFWDMLGSIPVQYIDCIPNVDSGGLTVLRLFRLFKLLRLTRLKFVILWLQKKFPDSVYFVTFCELFLYFFLFAHWTGCAFFFVAYGLADPNGSDYTRHLFEDGWVVSDGLLDADGNITENRRRLMTHTHT